MLKNSHLLFCLLFLGTIFVVGCQKADKQERQLENVIEFPSSLEVASKETGNLTPNLTPNVYNWWLDLDSENLNLWMAQLGHSNFSLKQLQEKYKALQVGFESIKQNNSPTLSASIGGDRKDGGRNSGLSRANSRKWFHDSGINTSWELDLWGELKAKRLAKEKSLMVLSEDINSLFLSLKGQLAKAYVQWVFQHEMIEMTKKQILLEEKALNVLEARFAQGRATSLDVLQQRELKLSRDRELPSLLKSKEEWQRQMALLLGKHKLKVKTQVFKIPKWKRLNEFNIKPQQLFKDRPDLRSRWFSLLEADQEWIAAKAARWPSLSLGFNLNGRNDSFSALPQSVISTISADLVAPIFDQNKKKTQIKQREFAQNELVFSLKELVINAIHEVENAYNGLGYIENIQSHLEEELVLSDKAYRESQYRYMNAQLDYINVLKQRSNLYLNEKKMIELNRNLWLTKIDLCMSLGWSGVKTGLKHAE